MLLGLCVVRRVVGEADLTLRRLLDAQYTLRPFYGTRRSLNSDENCPGHGST